MKVVSVRVTHCWSKSRVAKKISQPVLNKSGACATLLHCTVHINVCDPDGLGKGCNLAVDNGGDPTDLDFHLPAFLALRGPYAVSVAWFASARAPLLVLVQLLFGPAGFAGCFVHEYSWRHRICTIWLHCLSGRTLLCDARTHNINTT